MLRSASTVTRLSIGRKRPLGGAGNRRFSLHTPPGKPGTHKPDPAVDETPAASPAAFSTTVTGHTGASPVLTLPGSDDGDGGDGPTVGTGELSSFVKSMFRVRSSLVPKFDDDLVGLNESGVSPDSAMTFLSLLGDRGRQSAFVKAVLAKAHGLGDDVGASFRLAVPHHQYLIISRMHTMSPSGNRLLTMASGQDKIKKLVSCFPAGGTLDRVATLGRSGIVLPSHLHDVDLGDVMATYCMMTTTKWHALDGFLLWMMFHHKPSRQFCYAAYGSGKHRLRSVDRINPILGGAMMSTMTDVLAVALEKGFDLEGKTYQQIFDFLRKEAPELARRCEALAFFDRLAVAIAEYRELMGGNTVAKPETE